MGFAGRRSDHMHEIIPRSPESRDSIASHVSVIYLGDSPWETLSNERSYPIYFYIFPNLKWTAFVINATNEQRLKCSMFFAVFIFHFFLLI
jgi:hypothetical protein